MNPDRFLPFDRARAPHFGLPPQPLYDCARAAAVCYGQARTGQPQMLKKLFGSGGEGNLAAEEKLRTQLREHADELDKMAAANVARAAEIKAYSAELDALAASERERLNALKHEVETREQALTALQQEIAVNERAIAEYGQGIRQRLDQAIQLEKELHALLERCQAMVARAEEASENTEARFVDVQEAKAQLLELAASTRRTGEALLTPQVGDAAKKSTRPPKSSPLKSALNEQK